MKLNTVNLNFFTISDPQLFRSSVYLNGLLTRQKTNIKIKVFRYENLFSALKSLTRIEINKKEPNIDIVMYPSHILLPLIKLIRRNPVILDAGWSLYEGEIVSRGRKGFFRFHALRFYLIDFITSRFANLIFLESRAQKKYYCDKFKVNPEKCKVLYTGLNESNFSVKKFKKKKSYTILFRGKYNSEAGLEILAKTSFEILDLPIKILIYSPGIPPNLEFAKNTVVKTNLISQKQIAKLLISCHLSLGQLSDHNRLQRTIPHKAYESAYLGVPYLTARTRGITELFTEDDEILCFDPGDSHSLSNAIKTSFLAKRQTRLIGKRMQDKYRSQLSQNILTSKFISLVENQLQ